MLTPPPGLSSRDVADVIGQSWGLDLDSLDYQPVGFGSHHWVATDKVGSRHFVTADELSSASRSGDEVSVLGLHLRLALTAATDLRAIGCRFVVAPRATKGNHPLVQFGRYAVALYPFVDGQSFSFEEPFGEAEQQRVLEMVAELHRAPLTAVRLPGWELFVVPWLEQLGHPAYRDIRSPGPHAAAASQLLVDNEAVVRTLIARYRTLVDRYLRDPGPVVLTHGEIHPGNVMLTSQGWVLVDWDTALIGPRERDLWRLAQGSGSIARAYADATGSALDEQVLDLYRIRWDLAEIASFAAELRKPHEDTEDSRKALEILHSVVGRVRA